MKSCFAFVLTGFWLLAIQADAQDTVVSGRVTDAVSGDPIPFANVYFKGGTIGATTTFEGYYTLHTSSPTDSLVASYVGYRSKSKAVKRGFTQTIHFQLSEDVTGLKEVVVKAGENPAWEIIRKVIQSKSIHDKRNIHTYEYDTYTKIEVDVNHISRKLREKKVMKKIAHVLDSAERIAGEDGKPILPLLITESVSKVYYRNGPPVRKEEILKSKINGVGVEDGTLITQLIGSSFQEYNFYLNWLNILTKDFVSPIADGWRIYYDYYLTDSLLVGDDFCYRLDFYPKSTADLAFTGTMWITKKEFALRQIDATVGKLADVNFIDKIRIQQELGPTQQGAWLPVRNRMLVDVGELNENSAGLLAKFYTSNRNFVIGKSYPASFYENPIEVAEDVRQFEEEKYWDTLRHEPLTTTERNVYRMIDTLRNIPVIKTYTDIFKILIDGYYTMGKVDVGPYLASVAYNNIEGLRVQGGFRTNAAFSKHWVFGGQLAYGFQDQRVKYSAFAQHILSRRHWTTINFRIRRDVTRVGVDDENLAENPLFLVATRWGEFRRGYYFDESRLSFSRELFKGFTQRISVRHWTFQPTYDFGYYQVPNDTTSQILNSFATTEVSLESRFARDELFVQNGNQRVSLGTTRWPVITFRYTHGYEGLTGGDFQYDKIRLNINKRIKMGPLGYAMVTATGEYIFDTLPYPLLALHFGNQSPFYTPITYNLMNYGEFISDHYASLQYRHYFEGFLLNRIPLMEKLHWRLLGTANVIMGGMRKSNQGLIAPKTATGESTLPAGYLSDEPYVELGYGVENIFRFIRVDFVHRLSYLHNPGARSFGVLFSFQFQL